MGFLPTWLTSLTHQTPQQPSTHRPGGKDERDLLTTTAPGPSEAPGTLAMTGLNAEATVPWVRPCQHPHILVSLGMLEGE